MIIITKILGIIVNFLYPGIGTLIVKKKKLAITQIILATIGYILFSNGEHIGILLVLVALIWSIISVITFKPKLVQNEDGFNNSITIVESSNDILIFEDDKFTGSDNCIQCQFNPCKIKAWYKYQAIQACDFWNEINPNTLGRIIDRRGM